MSITLDELRRSLISDPTFGDEEEIDLISPLLQTILDILTRLDYLDAPVTPEGICTVQADLIEYLIGTYDTFSQEFNLGNTLLDGARQMREFAAERTDLIGDMTNEEIFTAVDSPLNAHAIELFRQGRLTYESLLHANSIHTLIPKVGAGAN